MGYGAVSVTVSGQKQGNDRKKIPKNVPKKYPVSLRPGISGTAKACVIYFGTRQQ
jgi:hypothetical protein